ncbi:MAG: hypothetical protein FJX74_01615 [Armatimonadetes bacterium]|nr:hypothetical protein [Armatimonadota bacterium]
MARAKTASRKSASEPAAVIDMTLQVPEGTASQYTNHVNVQKRVLSSGETEITVTFWQIPAFAVDKEAGRGVAVLLGSYVMPGAFAEALAGALAEHLGYGLSPEEEASSA